jgi:hypothetical protein
MSTKRQTQKAIQVCGHWQGMQDPVVMGTLYAASARARKSFLLNMIPLG